MSAGSDTIRTGRFSKMERAVIIINLGLARLIAKMYINSIFLWHVFNLFTTIHDGNFRRHSSMNVTIKWHKFSSNIYYIHVFFVIWSWKLRWQFQLQLTENRTPTPVYLDPGMHPGLEVKGLRCNHSGVWFRVQACASTTYASIWHWILKT